MKCDCDECCGTGKIECPECEGTGVGDAPIDVFPLDPRMRGYDELMELQADAARARRQAARLMELKPEHAASYSAQLAATLAALDRQARVLAAA